MAAPSDLKTTVNLPKTAFPMKANLPQNEPRMLARWREMRLYDRIRQVRKGAPRYVLHDGPPYANDAIHLGTALNKLVKDLVVKSKTMAGFDSPYVPGWDCHGLPIEIKVDKALGAKKQHMPAIEVRRACRAHAEKFVELHKQQFQRIGVFGRFDRPYLTMAPEYEGWILRNFFDFLESGLVYKGLRPVYWCIYDKTALAEAEVEYEPHTSPSVWVRYALTSDPAALDPALAGRKVSTIIWTTTPWTLPASMAVAFHPELEYVALESAGEVYLVADALAAVTREKCGLAAAKTLARLPGKKLEHATFAHPFLDRKILGILADYVTTEQGTGAVHTAPSHGADDFYSGVKYKLDQTCNVDASGRLVTGLPEYQGKTVFQANEPIVELLKSRGVLLHSEKIEHAYPRCWRCHNPVIFRATEQWFIAMDKPYGPEAEGGRTLRERALRQVQDVKWDPDWGLARLSNMLATRPDWCISRQRAWGVPIAVFFCEPCNELLDSKEVNAAVAKLIANEGADAWYTHEPASILPQDTKCPKCGGTQFRKEMDILDVWFESGSSHAAVLGHEEDLPWPANLYLEGADQYRGWFQSSLLCGLGVKYRPPFQAVATHGWVLDQQGRAMSKSLGNVVDPQEIANRMGGEIVRLWVAAVDFREDVRNSEELMQRIAEIYRKIRNTFRYVLGNLEGFDPAKHAVPFDGMEGIDQFMLLRTAEMAVEVQRWYDEFAFHKLYQRLVNFFITDLSAVYFDVLKDRLYTFAPGNRARRSAQTAIWRIGEALVRMVAPMMCFTADEVWQYLPAVAGRPESVHLSQFFKPEEITGRMAAGEGLEALVADYTSLLGMRDEVLKALEEARNSKLIGGSLEAQVALSAPEPLHAVLERHAAELRYLFIVSRVTVEKAPGGNGAGSLHVAVAKAPGTKCERCWNYSTLVGQDAAYPTVCERCSAALKEIESSR